LDISRRLPAQRRPKAGLAHERQRRAPEVQLPLLLVRTSFQAALREGPTKLPAEAVGEEDE
jgi:hypothetical protein